MSDWIGRTVSKVEIMELLGKGGMAEVYRGQHTTLKRPVAVKIIYSHLAEDTELLTRFSDEAQAVAAMRHPNIVQVFDYDVADDNSPYMIMEFLEGISLSDYLKVQHRAGNTLPLETVVHLMQGLADALDYAHTRGIVHRDMKPANVMLRHELGAIDPHAPLPEDVQPVLTDFGVARIANVTAVRTATGAIIGTPTYMSPEQVQGESVDSRSDIYALGVMLYEMLAGQAPFDPDTDTPAAILFKHVLEDPPPLKGVSPALREVVERAMAKDPNSRFQKAGDLVAALKVAVGVAVAAAGLEGEFEDGATVMSTTTQPLKVPKARDRARRFGLPIGLLAVIGGSAVVLLLVIVLAMSGLFGSEDEPTSEPTAMVAGAEPAEATAVAEEAEPESTGISADNARDVEQLGQFGGAEQVSYAMRLSPDGRQLAVFGFDGVIRLFDVALHREVGSLEGHNGPGRAMAYSPDGKLLASGGDDFRFFMWDLESERELYSFVADTNPSDIAFTPDGSKMVFVGGNSSRVFVIDLEGNEIGRISEHGVVLSSVDVSPDGTLIASGNSRGNIVISDLESLATVTTLNDGVGILTATKFSPDGAWLAAGSGVGDIWMWNTATWVLERTWFAQDGGVQYLAWSPDSSVLVSVGSDARVVLWDPSHARAFNEIQTSDGIIWKVDFASDASYFATLGGDEAVVRLFGVR